MRQLYKNAIGDIGKNRLLENFKASHNPIKHKNDNKENKGEGDNDFYKKPKSPKNSAEIAQQLRELLTNSSIRGNLLNLLPQGTNISDISNLPKPAPDTAKKTVGLAGLWETMPVSKPPIETKLVAPSTEQIDTAKKKLLELGIDLSQYTVTNNPDGFSITHSTPKLNMDLEKAGIPYNFGSNGPTSTTSVTFADIENYGGAPVLNTNTATSPAVADAVQNDSVEVPAQGTPRQAQINAQPEPETARLSPEISGSVNLRPALNNRPDVNRYTILDGSIPARWPAHRYPPTITIGDREYITPNKRNQLRDANGDISGKHVMREVKTNTYEFTDNGKNYRVELAMSSSGFEWVMDEII
jgi:hypothetical protein